jgi:hypothetical protein
VLPALSEDVPIPQLRGSYVNTYSINVNTSRILEEGTHSPSWLNGLIIIITVIIIYSDIAGSICMSAVQTSVLYALQRVLHLNAPACFHA